MNPRVPSIVVGLMLGQAVAGPLPGTRPLTLDGDLAARMVEGIDRYLTRELAAAPGRRQSKWQSVSSPAARDRFRRMIGLADPRVPFEQPLADPGGAATTTAGYRIRSVRWPVLPGVDGVGLLLEPEGSPVARVVALPDADWTPEQIAGLARGVAPAAQFARRLAENGCMVLIPVLLSRDPVGLYSPKAPRPTNQTHREFVYRMAFEMGRHVAGYEVQKVLAAVDWFERSQPTRPIGVYGYGEGGLLALYAAAADTRIGATVVSGYFTRREDLWREPVYRNVWGLLTEFGDAEVAGLVAPRALIVEAARGPEVSGAPSRDAGIGAAPGSLTGPWLADVRTEFERARRYFPKPGTLTLAIHPFGREEPGSDTALAAFLAALGNRPAIRPAAAPPSFPAVDAAQRERGQFEQLVEFTQTLVRKAEETRRGFWSKADVSSIDAWTRSKEPFRRHLWEEVFGRLPPATELLSAQTRQRLDRPRWIGYEVLLPVLPDVFAQGILLVPKDLKPGERRPLVVTQHGRAGRPIDLIEPPTPETEHVYKHLAAQLVERGFVVYAPQNPYLFEEQYRLLQRKANPLKLSLFSFILSQHQRTLDWLATLPFVDARRMGYYGLSYGGKTAVRVPPLLDRYALSICSADFNEYTGKMAGADRADSFMYTIEHEMYEFNLGNTFNYSEMASLMAPRPFMVERGHRDGVGFDEWVSYEYERVRRAYQRLGIAGRTEIEFFDGGHEIHAEATFRFLHKHLEWPERH